MTRIAPPIVAVLLAAALLCACGPPAGPPAAAVAAEEPAPAAADSGYVSPPELVGAVRLEGRLVLNGRAPPGAQVHLASPDGASQTVAADAKGAWSVTVPVPGAAPAMYALSAQLGGRTIRSEGAVLTLPRPGPPAVLVRAGFPALPLDGPAPRLRVVALDYDTGGVAAVAGVGPARARMRLSIDGMEAGLDQADAQGRFAVLGANQPLAQGLRHLQVETDDGFRTEVQATVSPAAPLDKAVFRAVRQSGGWRVDWARAGGGVQTTLVFDVTPETGT